MRILNIRAEGFYAGIEKRRDAELIDVPLVLEREGVVVDFCKHAAQYRLHRGMPLAHARRLLPRHHEKGWDPTSLGPLLEWLPALGFDKSPDVEVVSPQEIYLGVSSREDPLDILTYMLQETPWVHRFLMGCAKYRFMSQVARRRIEKEGVYKEKHDMEGRCGLLLSVLPGEEKEFLHPLSLMFLAPISTQSRERLRRLGLRRIGQLQAFPQDVLRSRFELELARRVHGLDTTPLHVNYPPQRLLWESELEGRCPLYLLQEAAEALAHQLEESGFESRELILWLLRSDGRWNRQSRRLLRPVRRKDTLCRLLHQMWREGDKEDHDGVRVRIELSRLTRLELMQPNFFSIKGEAKETATIHALIERVHSQYSSQTLFWGKHLDVSRREQVLSFWDPFRAVAKKE